MSTRKVAEAVARVVALKRLGMYHPDAESLAADLCDALAATLPNFDRDKFLTATRQDMTRAG